MSELSVPRIIYIHGFLSSSKSKKAQDTRYWLEANRPELEFLCPDLSSYPMLALEKLKSLLVQKQNSSQQNSHQKNYLIGSSLGGFWASHLLELGLAEKAVLINPAVSPHTRFGNLVGQTLRHYYSDEQCCLTQDDLETLATCEDGEIERINDHWLLAQTADEVLDYRLAERRFHACKQSIEKGGSHSFENYVAWLPGIIDFFEI